MLKFLNFKTFNILNFVILKMQKCFMKSLRHIWTIFFLRIIFDGLTFESHKNVLSFCSDWIQFNERDNQGEWSAKEEFMKNVK